MPAVMKINVFVEGNEDQELVAALLVKLGKVASWQESGKALRGNTVSGNQVNLNATNGWGNLISGKLFPELRQSVREGVMNLVVYDADRQGPQQGGNAHRRNQLLRVQEANDLFFELFLLPNDAEDGQLEDLLPRLIATVHQQVTDCFSHYENCVRQLQMADGNAYRLPVSKSRIFAYVEALPLTPDEEQKLESKHSIKFFANDDYWNLGADAIKPLRDFLNQYIQ